MVRAVVPASSGTAIRTAMILVPFQIVPDDVRVRSDGAPALLDGVAEIAVSSQPAEGPFEIRETEDSRGAVVQAAARVSPTNAVMDVDTPEIVRAPAGDFLDVDAWIRRGKRAY